MISIEQFYDALWGRERRPSDEQRCVVEAPASRPLFVVAGPGSGKTTSLTLRILKMILVDQVPPHGIIATTFTVKAADELRSRVLGWGFKLIDALASRRDVGAEYKKWLAKIDINQVWTGTLDSLCEQILRDHRVPGTEPPVLADDYVTRTLMLREGLFKDDRLRDEDLDNFLLGIHSEKNNRFNFNAATKVGLLRSIWDRRHMDLVDWDAFLCSGPKSERAGRAALDRALEDYRQALADNGLVDFSLLEYTVLQLLRDKRLGDFVADLKVLLVDEYQDTNLLQEQIYFELAQACRGALCVVGDDDQSLYRFRGATVDLFTQFASRYKERFGRSVQPMYLSTNYRSTKRIVEFVNGYASLDERYGEVRVKRKPALRPGPAAEAGRPVLAMFRPTREELAADLADFLYKVFRGRGYQANGMEVIARDPLAGDIGDCALLCSSPAEYAADRMRLPGLLRERLKELRSPIKVFNPRGEDFAGLALVRLFGGLLAECIDPGSRVQSSTRLYIPDAVLDDWRNEAAAHLKNTPGGLRNYVNGWQQRDPGVSGRKWPQNVSLLQLIYGLVHYVPELRDRAEGQVYLEVFTRQLAACEQVGKFKGRLVHAPDNPGLGDASVKELLREFLGPLLSGAMQVDEELITAFPRNELSILSIHQSKGLEFPLTIVDVGSDFATNHAAQAFKRFPAAGGPTQRMEDTFRAASELGTDGRTQVNRAFDDLYRQYFVAYSRPQDVLLLVGLDGCKPGGIRSAATGWDRDATMRWNTAPYMLI
jgi:DNA helicase-2/ATP-dependent DNA helicase PcrA